MPASKGKAGDVGERCEDVTWTFTVSDIQQHSVDLVNTPGFGLITGFLGRR